MKATKLLPYAITIAAVSASLNPAHAEDWNAIGQFGWFGVGKAYQIEKGHVYWVGEFTGTFFNDKGKDGLFDRDGVKCPGYFDFDINNKKGKAGGYCVISDTTGDQAYLSWQNEGDGVTGPERFSTPVERGSTRASRGAAHLLG